MKTVRIEEKTHTELTRIKGELTTQSGKSKSYDDAIMELINFWRKNH